MQEKHTSEEVGNIGRTGDEKQRHALHPGRRAAARELLREARDPGLAEAGRSPDGGQGACATRGMAGMGAEKRRYGKADVSELYAGIC